MASAAPTDVRLMCRRGELAAPTCGLAPGFAQANLVIVPKQAAFDFLLFCQRNPKPCPVLAVTDAGNPILSDVAPGADLRTDLPLYRVFRHGVLAEEVTDISHLWTEDMVGFVLGCSFSFEEAMLRAGLEVRHLTEARADGSTKNVPMFRTSIPCVPAGPFAGPLVVTMRPFAPANVPRAVTVTARYPSVHGSPIHIGDPASIGITDLGAPDYGDAVTVLPGEVPVFWACGVTPQEALLRAALPLAITHAPGHMLVCDISNESLAVL